MIITSLKQWGDFDGIPGVYKFHFKPNLKNYIGETMDLWDRIICQYPNEIKYTEHRPVINALRKYGWENIEIELLDWGLYLADKETRLALETAAIVEYNSLIQDGKGYNVCLYGDSKHGAKCSNITKQKIRLGNLNRVVSPETKLKMSLARTGKCCGKDNPRFGVEVSKETRLKMSLARKGRFTGKNNPHFGKHLSPEHKLKLLLGHKEKCSGEKNHNFGKHLSEETKRKLSITNSKIRGEKHPNFGRKMSEEQKQKLRLINLGKKASEETKSKMTLACAKFKKPVAQIDPKTQQVIKIWPSIMEAERAMKGNKRNISYKCNSLSNKPSYGFIWRFS